VVAKKAKTFDLWLAEEENVLSLIGEDLEEEPPAPTLATFVERPRVVVARPPSRATAQPVPQPPPASEPSSPSYSPSSSDSPRPEPEPSWEELRRLFKRKLEDLQHALAKEREEVAVQRAYYNGRRAEQERLLPYLLPAAQAVFQPQYQYQLYAEVPSSGPPPPPPRF
jgi:hypothetical protein